MSNRASATAQQVEVVLVPENEDPSAQDRQAAASHESAGGEAAAYPLFVGPEEYLRFRDPPHAMGFFKRWMERQAIARCLREARDVRRFCDAPCGPGRLFPVWQRWFPSVIGVEISDPMVQAAGRALRERGIPGEVRKGDAFHLRQVLGEPVDLVASVRFCYYFDRAARVRLLQALAAASRRYVFVQYKTLQTGKGRRNAARAARRPADQRTPKYYCTDDEVRAEFAEAGLRCLRIEPIAWASDFTFVLAEKVGPCPDQASCHTVAAPTLPSGGSA